MKILQILHLTYFQEKTKLNLVKLEEEELENCID